MAVSEKSSSAIVEIRQMDVYVKSFIAGGVAGMCAKTTVAPLDRIKILLQAHNRHYKHFGVFSGLRGIVRKESFFGLYKGNGAQMVRIFPYGAVQFVSFELYKKLLKSSFGPKSHSIKFFAGSMAGVTAVMFTYPLDVVRARLAFQVSGEHIYSGILDTINCIVKTILFEFPDFLWGAGGGEEGGVRALYKGLSPTVLGMIPYAGLSFYVFERLKHLCLEYMPILCGRPHSNSSGGIVLIVPAKLLCGGLAGAVAQTVSYPLDVARRKMQLSMMRPETHRFGKGLVTTLMLTFKEDGIMKGLYRGMSINYLRAIPMVAVSFSTYEVTKQLLGLDTGIES